MSGNCIRERSGAKLSCKLAYSWEGIPKSPFKPTVVVILGPVYIQIGCHVCSFGFAASTFESHSSDPFSSSLSFTLFSCSKVQSNPSS